MQGDKWNRIVGLEQDLKRVEEDYCWAAREGDREATDLLYLERGEVIHDLQSVSD